MKLLINAYFGFVYYTNCTLKCRMAISKFIMVNADTTTKEYAE